MARRRQTSAYLRKRFQEAGVRPNARRGQSFLTDQNLLEFLLRAAEIDSNDVVLEVGAGLGAFTAMLAENAGWVVTVEIDWQLAQMAEEELLDYDNVTFLQQDALRNKNNLHADVLSAVGEQLSAVDGRRFKLAANLPYSVATPILSNLILAEPTPYSMTVTIQKELADRIVAEPNSKDYSALSVWIQSLCDVQLLRSMPPSVFWPRPKVNSAIIQIKPCDTKRSRIPDLPFFHTFTRSAFMHRRKFLRSVVLSAFKGRLDKPAVDEIFAQLDLGPDARAEQLDLEMMFALCEKVRQTVGT